MRYSEISGNKIRVVLWASSASSESKTARLAKITLQDIKVDEGPIYGSGIADYSKVSHIIMRNKYSVEMLFQLLND